MATIEKLKKEVNGVKNDLYPVTKLGAVFDDNGNDLDTYLVIRRILIEETGSPQTITLQPNTLYVLGSETPITSNITFVLGQPISNIRNEYEIVMTTGDTAPTITFPNNISWEFNYTPQIVANKKYSFSILEQLAIFMVE